MTGLDQILGALDALLWETTSRQQFPRGSGVVTRSQETLWSKSCGYADLAAKRTATVVHTGSVTTIFAAITLMQLRYAGNLQPAWYLEG